MLDNSHGMVYNKDIENERKGKQNDNDKGKLLQVL